MKIAIVQIKPQSTFKKLKSKILEIIYMSYKKRDNMIVFPELTLQQYGKTLFKYNRNSHNFLSKVQNLAIKYNLHIIIASYIKENYKFYNRTFIYHPNGKYIFYDKIHNYPLENIDNIYKITSGTSPVIFKINKLTFGIMTCYDLRFLDLAKEYKKLGCDIIISPTAWVLKEKKKDLDSIAKRLAKSTKLYLLISDVAGHLGQLNWYGGSMVVDPFGNINYKSKNKEEVILFNIDSK